MRIVIVGGGVGGLAAAALLARDGHKVTLLEKNSQTGGRARLWVQGGYRFDMGPSWYLMPEVFEHFFSQFSTKRENYYALRELDPYYRVFFSPDEAVDIGKDPQGILALFDRLEPGGAARLQAYLAAARTKYQVAMKEFLYKNYTSPFHFFNRRLLIQAARLGIVGRLDRYVGRFFKDRRARQILEYHMVFLGTSPREAPSLYSILSHVDMSLGVHYPEGGLAAVAAAIRRLAEQQGAAILENRPVLRIDSAGGRARRVVTEDGESFEAEAVVVNADYAYAETSLLAGTDCSLPERYWRRRVLAPSMFILYLGLNRTLPALAHHNLYLAPDWDRHFAAVFRVPEWPQRPCFYASCVTRTDPRTAPPGHENLFLLVPVAPGLQDGSDARERYADRLLAHVERMTGSSIEPAVELRRVYSQRDFAGDYNAYRGTALGLAHTLRQTAFFRPPPRSRKLANLYYVGQYTHPGVGVPMVLIAAQLAAGLIREQSR